MKRKGRRRSLGLFNIRLRYLSGIRAPLCANILTFTYTRRFNNIIFQADNEVFSLRWMWFSFSIFFCVEKGDGASRNCDKVHTNSTPLYSIFIFHLFQLNVIRRVRFTFVPHWNSIFFGFELKTHRFCRHVTLQWHFNDAIDFCVNSFCIIAPLFGIWKTPLPRMASHIFIYFFASAAIYTVAANMYCDDVDVIYAYESATACRYIYFISIFRMSTEHMYNVHMCIVHLHAKAYLVRIWKIREKRIRPQLYAGYLHSFHLFDATRGTLGVPKIKCKHLVIPIPWSVIFVEVVLARFIFFVALRIERRGVVECDSHQATIRNDSMTRIRCKHILRMAVIWIVWKSTRIML